MWFRSDEHMWPLPLHFKLLRVIRSRGLQTFADPILTYVAELAFWRFPQVPRPNLCLVLSYWPVYIIEPLELFRRQSGLLTQFAVRRLYRWGWRSLLLYLKEIFRKDAVTTHYFLGIEWTGCWRFCRYGLMFLRHSRLVGRNRYL